MGDTEDERQSYNVMNNNDEYATEGEDQHRNMMLHYRNKRNLADGISDLSNMSQSFQRNNIFRQ